MEVKFWFRTFLWQPMKNNFQFHLEILGRYLITKKLSSGNARSYICVCLDNQSDYDITNIKSCYSYYNVKHMVNVYVYMNSHDRSL